MPRDRPRTPPCDHDDRREAHARAAAELARLLGRLIAARRLREHREAVGGTPEQPAPPAD